MTSCSAARPPLMNSIRSASFAVARPCSVTMIGLPGSNSATVRRVAELLPGKPIIVTEHGLATANDAERIEFISGGLAALHEVIADGIPLGGYIHWSAFDNFEWDRGYSMTFG